MTRSDAMRGMGNILTEGEWRYMMAFFPHTESSVGVKTKLETHDQELRNKVKLYHVLEMAVHQYLEDEDSVGITTHLDTLAIRNAINNLQVAGR